jgi:hypothetical protein
MGNHSGVGGKVGVKDGFLTAQHQIDIVGRNP